MQQLIFILIALVFIAFFLGKSSSTKRTPRRKSVKPTIKPSKKMPDLTRKSQINIDGSTYEIQRDNKTYKRID
jgi:hypothetical protein